VEKYDCLRNALAEAKIVLPPIEPRTFIDSSLSNTRGGPLEPGESLNGRGALYSGEKWDDTHFAYRGADGKNYYLGAWDIKTGARGVLKAFDLSSDYEQIESHRQSFDSARDDAFDTGTKLKLGQTGKTVDKMFRCFAP
jgi:hypothetical protein